MKSTTKAKLLAVLMSTSVLLTSTSVYADKLSDLRNEKSQTQNQANEKRNSVGSLNSQRDEVYSRIAVLNEEVLVIDKQITELQTQLTELNTSIAKTQEEIAGLKANIAENEESFSKRVKAMYMNSKMGSVEVLLSSDDLNDFLSRASMMKFVAEYDKGILNDLKHDKLELDAKESELNGKKASVEVAKNSLDEKLAEVTKNINEENALRDKLVDEIEVTEDEIASLEAQARNIDGKINKEEKAIAEAKAKAAREARNRQIMKQKEAAKAKEQSSNSSSSNSSSNNSGGNSGDYGSGNLSWPLPSSRNVTSRFGGRVHPVTGAYSFHRGLDIAAPMGSTIYSAGPGTVIHAAYTGSYGNLVKVKHDNGIVTYYAHCSGFIAGVGQRVSAKQAIAKVGSTGRSTGPHLHFEVVVGGSPQSPFNYVN